MSLSRQPAAIMEVSRIAIPYRGVALGEIPISRTHQRYTPFVDIALKQIYEGGVGAGKDWISIFCYNRRVMKVKFGPNAISPDEQVSHRATLRTAPPCSSGPGTALSV